MLRFFSSLLGECPEWTLDKGDKTRVCWIIRWS